LRRKKRKTRAVGYSSKIIADVPQNSNGGKRSQSVKRRKRLPRQGRKNGGGNPTRYYIREKLNASTQKLLLGGGVQREEREMSDKQSPHRE